MAKRLLNQVRDPPSEAVSWTDIIDVTKLPHLRAEVSLLECFIGLGYQVSNLQYRGQPTGKWMMLDSNTI
jgi:hypothetical protein